MTDDMAVACHDKISLETKWDSDGLVQQAFFWSFFLWKKQFNFQAAYWDTMCFPWKYITFKRNKLDKNPCAEV